MKTTFDQTTFSNLLKKAIGSRMQKEFASTIGISSAHLSRILIHRFDTPPSVETLKKIAANAENNVTYQELLSVCGYISESETYTDFSLPAEAAPSNKFVKATILTALEANDFSWELANDNEDLYCDLAIRSSTEDRLKWYFKFLSQKSEDQMRKQLSGNYLNLLFRKMENTEKLSFVTCSRTEFEIYLDEPPVNLNMNLSIILVNESQLDIQEERWLSRALPYKNAIEQLLLSK